MKLKSIIFIVALLLTQSACQDTNRTDTCQHAAISPIVLDNGRMLVFEGDGRCSRHGSKQGLVYQLVVEVRRNDVTKQERLVIDDAFSVIETKTTFVVPSDENSILVNSPNDVSYDSKSHILKTGTMLDYKLRSRIKNGIMTHHLVAILDNTPAELKKHIVIQQSENGLNAKTY